MRWRVLAGVSLLAAVAPAPAAHAAVPVLVIDGKGWGHGVGMAQDGAYWMGRAGQSANQILGHFYAGTSIGHASGTVTSLPARGRQYRGVISMTATGPLHFVDHIDVEQYLRGMGEVRDPSWPQASLKTQAIAARTYALRSLGGELCDNDHCQVYLGAGADNGAMDRAVSDSKGQAVTYGGGRASTFYSATAGGSSPTAPQRFGAAS